MFQTPATLAIGLFISAAIVILLGTALIAAAVLERAFTSWLQAQMRGVSIPFFQMVGFVFRKSDSGMIIRCCAKAREAGVGIRPAQIEIHALASGRPDRVLKAVIEAKEIGVELDWDTGCAIDLAGRDPLDFVRVSAETGCNIFEYAEQVPSSRSSETDSAAR